MFQTIIITFDTTFWFKLAGVYSILNYNQDITSKQDILIYIQSFVKFNAMDLKL